MRVACAISPGDDGGWTPPSSPKATNAPARHAVNPHICPYSHPKGVAVALHQVDASALDDMWSVVQSTEPQRCVWPAMAHAQGVVLASGCGPQEEDVC